MFKLNLKNKQLNEKQIAKLYAKKATEEKKRTEKLITEWLDQESDFNKSALIAKWEKYRKLYGFKFCGEAIKIMAMSNSVVDTNSFLQRKMKMEGVSIDPQDFFNLLNKIFILNITNAVINETDLPQQTKLDVLGRVVARQFPNKENRLPKLSNISSIEELLDTGR